MRLMHLGLEIRALWAFGRRFSHDDKGTPRNRSCLCIFNRILRFLTPSGRAMMELLSTFAKFERDIIRERVKVGIANVR